jgi:hypothetical protein
LLQILINARLKRLASGVQLPPWPPLFNQLGGIVKPPSQREMPSIVGGTTHSAPVVPPGTAAPLNDLTETFL